MLLDGAVIVLNSVCAWLESGSVRGALLMCLEECSGRGANSLRLQLVIEEQESRGVRVVGVYCVTSHGSSFPSIFINLSVFETPAESHDS